MADRHEESDGYKLTGVAASILVMGVSIALVIILWVWFGHIGPTFSSTQMLQQQDQLIKQYGLPPREKFTKEQLEIPPSLRNVTNSTR
ncbi:MAG: hypothetical protein ABI347_07805 [Nitrososphaera sp.]|jgi:hypothetical protein